MKMLLYIFFFILCQLTVNAQMKPVEYHTEIIYKYTFQGDSTSTASSKSVMMQLMVGDKESHYQSVAKAKSDSTLALDDFKSTFYSYGGINPNNYLIVKKDDIIQTFEPVTGVGLTGNNELSYYEQTKKDLKWEVHTDTIHKGTFVAQRATTTWGGREWTAWFTMEVPISEGPYKFSGLPGLIVAMSDQDKYFNFDLISVRLVKRTSLSFEKIRPSLSLLKTSHAAFYAERKKLRGNMIEYGALTGSKFNEEAKKSILQQTKADNNFIERY
ncbi:MAG: GLPGLI family protein [Flavobacteriales bacterium]|nr:MAG: GLPGLI family protein [Flavobacteriales bacterium]